MADPAPETQPRGRHRRTAARILGAVVVLAIGAVIVLSDLGYRDRIFGWAAGVPGGDTTGHVVLMGLLTLSAIAWLGPALAAGPGRSALLIGAGVALFLLLEEGSQWLLPTRTFDPGDLAANCCGTVLGGLAGWLWTRR